MGHVLGLRRKILKETQEAEECLVSHPLRLALAVMRGRALPAARGLGRGRGGRAWSRRRRDSVGRRRLWWRGIHAVGGGEGDPGS